MGVFAGLSSLKSLFLVLYWVIHPASTTCCRTKKCQDSIRADRFSDGYQDTEIQLLRVKSKSRVMVSHGQENILATTTKILQGHVFIMEPLRVRVKLVLRFRLVAFLLQYINPFLCYTVLP